MVRKILSVLWVYAEILLALPVVIILSLILFLVAFRVDILYDVALFIPEKLGLTFEVSDDQILRLDSRDQDVVYLENGRYRIFSGEPIGSWVTISFISQETGSVIQATTLYTGEPIRIFEPQFIFNLKDSGSYQVNITTIRGGGITDEFAYRIEPYYGNQNSFIAILSGVLLVGLVVFGFRWGYQYLRKDELKSLKASQSKKRDEWESFLADKKEKGKDEV